jgi:hypothetical protein
MSTGAIEPSAVISPNGRVTTGRQRIYDTYNTRDIPIGGDSGGSILGSPKNVTQNVTQIGVRLPGGGQQASVPDFLPKFLGSRQIILFSWVAAMGMVSLDEWHTYHILPRPARLWDTSLTFLLIAAVSSFDPLVPICTVFAIGLVIMLGYQYYQGAGQFCGFGATEANKAGGSGPLPAPGTQGATQNA